MFQLSVGVEDHRRPAAQQRLCPAGYCKFVQRGATVTREQQGIAKQVGFHVIEAQHLQLDIPQSGEKSSRGPCFADRDSAGTGQMGSSRERAMYGHRLRGIFDSTSDAEAALRAQWIVGGAMRPTAAANMLCIPFDYLIEQAHAAAVGNVSLDPATV
jgi:hypothetical protein